MLVVNVLSFVDITAYTNEFSLPDYLSVIKYN